MSEKGKWYPVIFIFDKVIAWEYEGDDDYMEIAWDQIEGGDG